MDHQYSNISHLDFFIELFYYTVDKCNSVFFIAIMLFKFNRLWIKLMMFYIEGNILNNHT